jgi:hypothetical protein
VNRDADGLILSIHDYSQQSVPNHAAADNPGRDSIPYKNASTQTQNMILLYLNGGGTREAIAPFYPLAPNVRAGVPGPNLGFPKNTTSPMDLLKKLQGEK